MNLTDFKLYALIAASVLGPFAILELIRIYTPLI